MLRFTRAVSSITKVRAAAPLFALPSRAFSEDARNFFHDYATITRRVTTVVENFDRIDPANKVKIAPAAKFSTDLGLDSLDSVELVLAMEDEFAVEISDADSDKFTSIEDVAKFIAANPSAK
jgi:NADH dehydrogenase (ubiquinone) 1 alpha/beta subcomplex 1